MSELNSVSRRTFVSSAAAGAALAGVACAGLAQADEAKDDAKTSDYADRVTETVDVDIVVLGSGVSGLAAANEAAELGANVLVLESQDDLGGNATMIVDVFGIDSSMQKAEGIEIDLMEVVNNEIEAFCYQVDSQRWVDMLKNSGDNIDWLIEKGVEFSEVYNKTASNDLKATHRLKVNGGYAEPMVNAAKESGVEFRLNTAGKELILKDGKVVGVYAETEDGVLQVNAGAVIVATGGYGTNKEMIESRLRTDMDHNLQVSRPGHDGDGILMSVAAGAKDLTISSPVFMVYPVVYDTGFVSICLTEQGPLLWVNQDGVRFVREDVGLIQPGYRQLATSSQKVSYGVANIDVLNIFEAETQTMTPDGSGVIEAFDALVEKGADNMFKADTIEELAEIAPVDAETFIQTVKDYNALCDAGEDTQYRKSADQLVKLENGPFYLFRWDMYFTATVNGVHTSRKAEALTSQEEPIPGLYVVGLDGCELYSIFYTLSAGGSCNANNVNSGRTAAREACATLGIA